MTHIRRFVAGRSGGRSRVVVSSVAAILLGLVVSGAGACSAGQEDEPFQVVEDFREAREQGHCDRLVDLVAETSWSDGGSLTRDEFLEICPGVVDGYEPMEVDEPELVEQNLRVDGDTAEVDVDGYEPARLVREGGRWRVVLGGVLRLGRTPHQAVIGYLEAYNEGDCAALIDFVSAAAWSGGGGSRDDYLEDCNAEMSARRSELRIEPHPDWEHQLRSGHADPIDGEDEITDEVGTVAAAERIQTPPSGFWQDVRLVEEGLEWKLESRDDIGGPLTVVRAVELATRLLPRDQVEGTSDDDGSVAYDLGEAVAFDSSVALEAEAEEVERALRDEGFSYGARNQYDDAGGTGSVTVDIRRFATEAGADADARRVVDLQRASHPDGVLPVPASAGATYGFVVRSELTAGEGGTSSDYVEAAYLVAVQDTTVVAVWYDLGGSPPPPAAEPDAVEQATAILTAQLDRL